MYLELHLPIHGCRVKIYYDYEHSFNNKSYNSQKFRKKISHQLKLPKC